MPHGRSRILPRSLLVGVGALGVVALAVGQYLEWAQTAWLQLHPITANLISSIVGFSTVTLVVGVGFTVITNRAVRRPYEAAVAAAFAVVVAEAGPLFREFRRLMRVRRIRTRPKDREAAIHDLRSGLRLLVGGRELVLIQMAQRSNELTTAVHSYAYSYLDPADAVVDRFNRAADAIELTFGDGMLRIPGESADQAWSVHNMPSQEQITDLMRAGGLDDVSDFESPARAVEDLQRYKEGLHGARVLDDYLAVIHEIMKTFKVV